MKPLSWNEPADIKNANGEAKRVVFKMKNKFGILNKPCYSKHALK